MTEQHTMIELHHIIKRFYIGQPNELEILHGIDLKVNNLYPSQVLPDPARLP